MSIILFSGSYFAVILRIGTQSWNYAAAITTGKCRRQRLFYDARLTHRSVNIPMFVQWQWIF